MSAHRGTDRLPAWGLASAVAAGLALASSSPAEAHRGMDFAPQPASVIGDSAELTGAGLFRVGVGAETLLTHGPDRGVPTAGDEGSRFAPGAPQRPPVCASNYHQHLLVGHLVDEPDRIAAVAADVRAAIGRMNHVLNAAAVASGGPGADYKVLCDSGGEIKVDSFASPSEEFDDIVGAARAAGFDRQNADYMIFFDTDADDACGIASYEEDERLTESNLSNRGGGYAVTYEPCWFGSVPMHESAHTQGAVPYGSPNSTGTGAHCNQSADVMCYTPDGGDRNQGPMVKVCDGEPEFDCAADDYFDAAPEPGEYLATHWNLGSPLNRFISFGSGAPPVPDAGGVVDDLGAADPGPETACTSPRCATRLRLGMRVDGQAGAGRLPALYRLAVPRRVRALRIKLFSSEPLSLSVARGTLPEPGSSECRPRYFGGHQACRIRRPSRGRWFLAVTPTEGADVQAVEFELRARGLRRWMPRR